MPPGPETTNRPDRTEEFVGLLSRHQQELHTFIHILIPQCVDADDVMQKTSIVLWQKFDQFQAGTNFAAWSRQVARLEVLRFYRSKARDRLVFDDALVESLAEVQIARADELLARRQALFQCREKLRPSDRQLLEHCYNYNAKKTPAKDVAAALERPVNTVYKALIRIRHALFECIEQTLRRDA